MSVALGCLFSGALAESKRISMLAPVPTAHAK